MNIVFSLKPWLQAIIAGFITGLSFHPLNIGFFSWFSFIPLFHIFLISNLKQNLINGFVFGLSFNLTAFYWIGSNSGADSLTVLGSLVAATSYLAIFWLIGGFLFSLLPLERRKESGSILFPFLIVSIEWLRSFGPLGFPWANLALSQSKYNFFIQYIDLTGSYGVSFIIISFNVIFYHIIQNNISLKNGLSFITVIIFGISITGWSKIHNLSNSNKIVNVAIVQPNIDPNIKWQNKKRIISFMDSLHLEAVNLNPDLVVFPETALPSYLVRDSRTRNMLQKTVNYHNVPLLTGTIHTSFEMNKRYYFNSSMFIKPNEKFNLYSKIHLVPFAEYDLFPAFFHPLSKLNINIDRGNFKAGDNYTIFEFNDYLFSNLICYESSMPNVSRKFVEQGAEFLVIQANDGWLKGSYGPDQHFELARLRAIENRVPIIRSANTGISGVINPDGKVQNKIKIDQEKIILERVELSQSGSFYTKFGDIFALFCFLITSIFTLYSCKERFL